MSRTRRFGAGVHAVCCRSGRRRTRERDRANVRQALTQRATLNRKLLLGLDAPQQLDERRRGLPVVRRMAHRRRVEIEKAYQDLADNQRANRAE
jgi:hypothetical protein